MAKHVKTGNELSTDTTPESRITSEQRDAISLEGKRFRDLGWNKSDANASAERVGKIMGGSLAGTGRALVVAIRSAFGDANGALSSGGSYEESQRLFGEISSADMGTHFVRAVESVLSGVVLPAALNSTRARGVRRGSL